MPERPAMRFCQNESTPIPIGETTPTPVTTTRGKLVEAVIARPRWLSPATHSPRKRKHQVERHSLPSTALPTNRSHPISVRWHKPAISSVKLQARRTKKFRAKHPKSDSDDRRRPCDPMVDYRLIQSRSVSHCRVKSGNRVHFTTRPRSDRCNPIVRPRLLEKRPMTRQKISDSSKTPVHPKFKGHFTRRNQARVGFNDHLRASHRPSESRLSRLRPPAENQPSEGRDYSRTQGKSQGAFCDATVGAIRPCE